MIYGACVPDIFKMFLTTYYLHSEIWFRNLQTWQLVLTNDLLIYANGMP